MNHPTKLPYIMIRWTLATISIFVSFGVFPVQAQKISRLKPERFTPRSVTSYDNFKLIPIFYQDQLITLEAFAEKLLVRFSQDVSMKKNALSWLAQLLFYPESSFDQQIFFIKDDIAKDILGLNIKANQRYSYLEMEEIWGHMLEVIQNIKSKPMEEWREADKDVLMLFENLSQYIVMSSSFSFTFPHDDFEMKYTNNFSSFGFNEEQAALLSYIDIALQAETLNEKLEFFRQFKNSDFSDEQQEMERVVESFYQWSLMNRDQYFKIIPIYKNGQLIWVSPWDSIALTISTENGKNRLRQLQDMAQAYWNGHQIKFDLSVKLFMRSTSDR